MTESVVRNLMSKSATPTPPAVARALTALGEDISTWRRLRRLTSAQVAERAGLSRSTVASLENGKGASLENTLRIARALGVLDELAASIDPYATDVGRLRSEEILPKRVRHRRL